MTLLSFLFKKFNIIKKGINIKDTLKLYAACLVVSYTQRPSGFKAIIKMCGVNSRGELVPWCK
jgi:hypothetical protein